VEIESLSGGDVLLFCPDGFTIFYLNPSVFRCGEGFVTPLYLLLIRFQFPADLWIYLGQFIFWERRQIFWDARFSKNQGSSFLRAN